MNQQQSIKNNFGLNPDTTHSALTLKDVKIEDQKQQYLQPQYMPTSQSLDSVSSVNQMQDSSQGQDGDRTETTKMTERALKHFEEFVKNTNSINAEGINLEIIREFYNIKYTKLPTTEDIREQYYKLMMRQTYGKLLKKNWNDMEINILVWIVVKASAWKRLDCRNINDEIWEDIAKMMIGRTAEQCKFKWLSLSKLNLQQIPWTQEEDDYLLKIINQFSQLKKTNKWSEIARELNSRSGRNVFRAGKQCRERWNNHLDPNINRGPWSDQEDLELLRLIVEKGKKWSEVSKSLKNSRTENSVKNRFNSLIKKEKQNIMENHGAERQKLKQEGYFEESEIIRSLIEKIQNRIKNGFTIMYSEDNDQFYNNDNDDDDQVDDEENCIEEEIQESDIPAQQPYQQLQQNQQQQLQPQLQNIEPDIQINNQPQPQSEIDKQQLQLGKCDSDKNKKVILQQKNKLLGLVEKELKTKTEDLQPHLQPQIQESNSIFPQTLFPQQMINTPQQLSKQQQQQQQPMPMPGFNSMGFDSMNRNFIYNSNFIDFDYNNMQNHTPSQQGSKLLGFQQNQGQSCKTASQFSQKSKQDQFSSNINQQGLFTNVNYQEVYQSPQIPYFTLFNNQNQQQQQNQMKSEYEMTFKVQSTNNIKSEDEFKMLQFSFINMQTRDVYVCSPSFLQNIINQQVQEKLTQINQMIQQQNNMSYYGTPLSQPTSLQKQMFVNLMNLNMQMEMQQQYSLRSTPLLTPQLYTASGSQSTVGFTPCNEKRQINQIQLNPLILQSSQEDILTPQSTSSKGFTPVTQSIGSAFKLSQYQPYGINQNNNFNQQQDNSGTYLNQNMEQQLSQQGQQQQQQQQSLQQIISQHQQQQPMQQQQQQQMPQQQQQQNQQFAQQQQMFMNDQQFRVNNIIQQQQQQQPQSMSILHSEQQ